MTGIKLNLIHALAWKKLQQERKTLSNNQIDGTRHKQNIIFYTLNKMENNILTDKFMHCPGKSKTRRNENLRAGRRH